MVGATGIEPATLRRIALQAREIIFDLCLQLPDLLKRPLGQRGKVLWIDVQNTVALRFKNPLHASHLLDRLKKLLWRFNHSAIFNKPFSNAGRALTCWKNATASS